MVAYNSGRGQSTYVSAILLTLVVVVVGALLLSHFLGLISLRQQELTRQQIGLEIRSKEDLGCMGSYIDSSGNLIIILSTGDFPVDLDGVYVNNTRADCQAYFRGSWNTIPASIPSRVLAVVKCPLAEAQFVEINIVYGGGRIYCEATRV